MAKRKPKTQTPDVVDTTQALAVREPSELQPAQPQEGAHTIVEKLIELAGDPGVNVEKINALIDANARVVAIAAKQRFDEAFAKMQAELPVIRKGGVIRVEKEGRLVRETPYARDVDITTVVRPVLARHGFSLRHRNKIENGKLTVVGILSHCTGHREEDEFGPIDADTSGAKNLIQAWGSARQYGRRYTTIALLNISSDEFDDDGAGFGPPVPAPQAHERAHPNELNTKPITDGQRRRLFAILKAAGRSEAELKTWLLERFHIDSTKKIERRDYDFVCESIEKPGILPVDREPGEEG